jgi:hypothetical protein
MHDLKKTRRRKNKEESYGTKLMTDRKAEGFSLERQETDAGGIR